MGKRVKLSVTHLSTGDFPFVRYRTGDVGSLSDASVSLRARPAHAGGNRRALNRFRAVLPMALYCMVWRLIYVLREMPEVEEFKIIQESITHMTVQLVTSSSDTEQLEKR